MQCNVVSNISLLNSRGTPTFRCSLLRILSRRGGGRAGGRRSEIITDGVVKDREQIPGGGVPPYVFLRGLRRISSGRLSRNIVFYFPVDILRGSFGTKPGPESPVRPGGRSRLFPVSFPVRRRSVFGTEKFTSRLRKQSENLSGGGARVRFRASLLLLLLFMFILRSAWQRVERVGKYEKKKKNISKT